MVETLQIIAHNNAPLFAISGECHSVKGHQFTEEIVHRRKNFERLPSKFR